MAQHGSAARDVALGAMAGRYIHRQVNEDDEARAQRKIGGLLNAWRKAMADRDGIMSSNDGSELRFDELRCPSLPKERRSQSTREDPLENVTAPAQADHAIQMFHNLMFALDAMIMNDTRDVIRLHLTAEFVLIRALIETAATALWILGPDDSDTRVTRALRLRHDELKHSLNLSRNFAKLAHALHEDAYLAQKKHVDGHIEDLKTLAAHAGLTPGSIAKDLSPSVITAEAGVYLPQLGGPTAYWYWSTASSLSHGEPTNLKNLSDMKFIGVDHRDAPVGHLEPSASSILLHLDVAHQLIGRAHQLWNERARAPE